MDSLETESEFHASSRKMIPRVQALLLPQPQLVLPGTLYYCRFLQGKGKPTDLPAHLQPPHILLRDIQP